MAKKLITDEHRKNIGIGLLKAYESGKRTPWQKTRKFTADHVAKITEGLKKSYASGERQAWNKGKKNTPEYCQKMSEIKKGQKPHDFTPETIENMKIANRKKALIGEKAHRWNGGITPLTKLIRGHHKSSDWRDFIFKRDDYTCQTCFQRGVALEAHHIKPFAVIFHNNKIKSLQQAIDCAEFWDVNNGVSLCLNCHNTTKKGKGTKNA